MKLEKIKKTYNDYKLEVSWGQVEAIAAALEQNHADPLADELFAEWQWYMERVPGPGEDEEAFEQQQKAAEGGGMPGAEGAVEGEDIPVAMPPGSQAGTPAAGSEAQPSRIPHEEEGGEGGPEGGGADVGLPEPEGEMGGAGGPEGGMPGKALGGGPERPEPESADLRLPKPPRE